jgi:hypothetical protein
MITQEMSTYFTTPIQKKIEKELGPWAKSGGEEYAKCLKCTRCKAIWFWRDMWYSGTSSSPICPACVHVVPVKKRVRVDERILTKIGVPL